MQNRTDIKDFVLEIEQEFPVNNWKINNLHIWPILRIRLFFYLINEIEGKQKKRKENSVDLNKKGILEKIKNKLKQKLNNYTNTCYYYYWKFKLPQKDNLFLGSDSHRVNYRGSRYNRYFDVIIERENLFDRSLYFEYASNLDNQYNKHLIYKYNRALKGFLSLNRSIDVYDLNFDGYSEFLDKLKADPILAKFAELNTELKLLSWFKNRFGIKLLFFEQVLKNIKPKQVAVLCYYSEDLFALLASSNKLGISTIDMQHGPQTDIHLSYGSWSCIPQRGYDVLPRTFWCWDTYSQKVMEKWTLKNNLYSAVVKGNPWVDYWKSKSNTYKYNDFVLYSLQPNPITLEQSFTNQVIKSIKKCKYKWFIRLHPRQLDQMSDIKKLLQAEDVLHLINIDDATYDPLPELLANSKIHITHSSGSTIEASLFGLKTILINEIGFTSFPDLIERKEAFYIDYKDKMFSEKFKRILEELESTD